MLILNSESTFNDIVSKRQRVVQGVKLISRLILRFNLKIKLLPLDTSISHNCKKLDSKLQPKVRKTRGKCSGFHVHFRIGEHL